jgi:ABC-type branched-subunit amino acid transport system substrate-binding protein
MMNRNAFSLYAVCVWIVTSLVFPGCQGAKVVRQPPPSFEGLQGCLEPAPTHQDMQDKQRCVSLLERFLRAEPTHPRADDMAFRLGQLYLETGDFSAAYHVFHNFPEEHPKAGKQAELRLYLGVALYFLDNPMDSLEVLHTLTEDPKSAPWAKEIFRYIAENYVKLEVLPSALTWYSRCLESAEGEEDRERLRNRVLEVMSIGWEPEALEAAMELFPEGFLSEAIHLGVVATCVQRGQLRLAEDHLMRLSVQHPDDVFTPHIQALLDRMEEQGQPRICTIGCLLPLTGKYARFGESVLDAILLGARAFQSPEQKGSSIRLQIRDTQGDPEVGARQVRELAEDPHVVGIVGPLRAAVALSCAEEAQKLAIPIITLTQREEVARVGDYVFQNGLTIRQQVDTLVEFVMDEMAFSSFAVLYPKDAYGTLSRDLLVEKVLDMGGEVVSAVPYEDRETDFQDEIRLLVGQEFLQEVERREKEREQNRLLEEGLETAVDEEGMEGDWPGTADAIGPDGEPLEEEPVLPPFQVLFIPDHFRKVALIAPHLALYDVNEITLLGTNAWNSNQLVELAGEYVRDAIFADGFFAESNMPYVREFVEDYLRAFQTEPRVLEAQGYDSLLMLEDSFLQAETKTRDLVREALAGMQGYPGLSGYTSFNEDGSAKKRLYILSIIGNHIQQIY